MHVYHVNYNFTVSRVHLEGIKYNVNMQLSLVDIKVTQGLITVKLQG